MPNILNIPLIDPGWAEQRLPRVAGLIAVMNKELLAQQRQMRVWWRLLLRIGFILVCFGWLFSLVLTDNNDYEAIGGISSLLILLALAQVLPEITGTIAREREIGALDMLLLTSLRSIEIIAGKLIAACLPACLILLGTMSAGAIMFQIAGMRIWTLLLTALRVFLGILFAATVGLICSAWYGRSGQALGATVGILLFSSIISTGSVFFQGIVGLYGYSPFVGLYRSNMLTTAVIFGIATAVLTARGRTKVYGKKATLPFQAFIGVIATASFLVIITEIVKFFIQANIIVDSTPWALESTRQLMLRLYLLTVPFTLFNVIVLFWLATARLEALRRKA